MLTLDLAEESTALLQAARDANIGHAAKTLVKDGPLRVVIIGFRAGATLQEHRTAGPLTIQALAGSTTISAGGESHDLAQGSVLVFGSAISHSVSAAGDAVLLLTLAQPES